MVKCRNRPNFRGWSDQEYQGPTYIKSKMSTGKHKFQNKEAVHRINYLYQAAEHARRMGSKDGKKLMYLYGVLLKKVSEKTQTKLDYNLKRTICKGCSAILVPGDTAVVRVAKKPNQQIIWICNTCGTYRVFGTRPDYELWEDKPLAIVETIKCHETPKQESQNPAIQN
ncbi:ribonuclease P protein subunit rpr2-like [Cimex lectularius]|uniref:Uncharacterized protein n=1 Tax=Cimex lectularius TaxID=79782 RepID=A0A8I6SS22_CIMLE|nr:ribonuclease P protein subunit rpr2-like [Cimex lectularius]